MQSNTPYLSVVCPTYNQGKYLSKGLDSILNQKTSFSFEILIGEDHSPDNTNDLLKEYEEKYPNRLTVYHRTKNLKQSKNIYDLFMKTRGDYVIVLDLDDYWTDNCKLQKQVDFLDAHPEIIGVSHDFDLIDQNGIKIEETTQRPIKRYLGKKFTLENFLEEGFVFQTGTFCYRNIWKEKRDWSILHMADETVVDLTINSILLQRNDIYIMDENMSVYRDVMNVDAKNFRSLCAKDKALDYYQMAAQLEKLDEYFQGNIHYELMWCRILWDYFKDLMKKENGSYSLKQWVGMYKRSSKDAKNCFKSEISSLIKRRINKA